MATQKFTPVPPRVKDITGQIFGRLTVLQFSHSDPKWKIAHWVCRCQCGTIKTILGSSLKSGNTPSCGCQGLEHIAAVGHRNATHGKSGLPEYNVWVAMLSRCFKKSNASYGYYGDRGITVCDRWLNVESFLNDMGTRPTPKHTIDRIDNNGNYSPDNCRWVTRTEQQNNRRVNIHVTHRGETHTVKEWALLLGMPPHTLYYRVKHWPIEQAMTLPPMKAPHNNGGRFRPAFP